MRFLLIFFLIVIGCSKESSSIESEFFLGEWEYRFALYSCGNIGDISNYKEVCKLKSQYNHTKSYNFFVDAIATEEYNGEIDTFFWTFNALSEEVLLYKNELGSLINESKIFRLRSWDDGYMDASSQGIGTVSEHIFRKK